MGHDGQAMTNIKASEINLNKKMPLLNISIEENDMQASWSRNLKAVDLNDEPSLVVKEGINTEGELVFRGKNQSFNASNYKVLYEELMKNSKGREIFQTYLKTEACSEEPILFLNAIDDLKTDFDKIKNTEPSLKLLKKYFEKLKSQVVEKFIREKSNTELNLQEVQQEKLLRKIDEEIEPHLTRVFSLYGKKLSNTSPRSPTSPNSSKYADSSLETASNRSLVELELHQFCKTLDPDVLFYDIIISVHVDLKLDQFPRFSRSKFLLEHLDKLGESFTRQIAVDISRGFNVDIRFLPNDLSKNFIYDKDIYFGLGLVEDSPDWENIPCTEMSKHAQLYHSKTSYSFGNKTGMKLYKMVTTLPYRLDDVHKVFCHIQGTDTADHLTENRTIGYNAPNQAVSMTGVDAKTNPLAVRYITSSLKLLLPGFKEREFPRTMTSVYDSGLDAYINVGHTTEFSFHQVDPNRIIMDMFLVNIMYRIREDSTRFIFVIYMDAHTPKVMDAIFAKVHWRKRCAKLEQTFHHLLKKPNQQISDNFKLEELVQENQKVYPERSWYREYLNMFHK